MNDYMTLQDYSRLKNFTVNEVLECGGNPVKMKKQSMIMIQELRTSIKRRIRFCKNGLNSGTHTHPSHPHGEAFDIYLDNKDGTVGQDTLYEVFRKALKVGFKGIGFYFNGVVWSIHLDWGRTEYDFWVGRKARPGAGGWTYRKMFIGGPAN